MSIGSLLAKVATIAGAPGIGTVIGMATMAVNAFKGKDEQVPENASQAEVEQAFESLPAAEKAAVVAKLENQLGMEKEHTSQMEILAKADGVGSSTRPAIAMMMAWVMVLEITAFTGFMFYVISVEGVAGLKALGEVWVVFGVLTGTPVAILLNYFNIRTKEKRTRYAVAHGQSANLSGIGALISAFKK